MDSTGAFAMPLETRRRRLPLVAVALAAIGTAVVLVVGAVWVIRGDNEQSEPEVLLFLDTEITDEQLDALETKVKGHPGVASIRYLDEEASRSEFERLFENDSSMLEWLEDNPDSVPTSFRITPEATDEQAIASLIEAFAGEGGVVRAISSEDRDPASPTEDAD